MSNNQKPATANNPNAIAKSAAKSIGDLIQANLAEIAKVVPKHVTPERLLKVLVACISKTPALAQCTPESLVASFKVAAELGLEPGGSLGQLYLVPFGNVCTPIIGYRGFIDLMRRSGHLADVRSVVVHQRDKFHIKEGLVQDIQHEPFLEGDPGPMRFVYTVFKLKDGTFHAEFMTKDAVDRIKGRSRSGNSGPWVTDYEEMAKKTVLRRGAKYMPMSSELSRAVEADDEAEVVDGQVMEESRAMLSDSLSATERAKAKVGGRLRITDDTAAPSPTPPQPDQIPVDAPANLEQPLT